MTDTKFKNYLKRRDFKMADIAKLLEEIDSLTVIELSELVKK